MVDLPHTFGLLHLPTMRFARYDDVERYVFHRLDETGTKVKYPDERSELEEAAPIYETQHLWVVLNILAFKPDRFRDFAVYDGYGDGGEEGLGFDKALLGFAPVAFVRTGTRLKGIGDFVPSTPKVWLVVDADAEGENYRLAEIPA